MTESPSTANPTLSSAALADLLAWYQAAGVDCALTDEPINWMDEDRRAPGAGFDWPAAGASQGTRNTSPLADSQRGRPGSNPPRAEGRPGSDHPAPNRHPAHDTAAAIPAQPQRNSPAARGNPAVSEGSRAPPARFASGAPEAAQTEARKLARKAADLASLAEAIANFDGCALKATAKSTCVYRGAETARLMLIGEAPGRDEDIEGRPFVGRAGQLLDRMLAAIDLDETSVHITNVVYWRPPGNRTPTPQETQICRPFLERQVELVGPEFVVLLGGAAAKSVLATDTGIMRLRGKWHEIELGGRRVKALATLHPAYLLRTPAAKRAAWRDFLSAKTEFLKITY